MDGRKTSKSRIVAFSAVGAALGTMFLTVGAYTGLGVFFWYFIASVCVMITFHNRSIMGSLMSFVVCCVLSLLASGFNIIYLLPYIIFFGAYPIAIYIEETYKVNKVLMIVITCLWFDAALYVFYLFTKLFVTDIAFINEYHLPIIAIGGTIAFFGYRIMMKRLQQKSICDLAKDFDNLRYTPVVSDLLRGSLAVSYLR